MQTYRYTEIETAVHHMRKSEYDPTYARTKAPSRHFLPGGSLTASPSVSYVYLLCPTDDGTTIKPVLLFD